MIRAGSAACVTLTRAVVTSEPRAAVIVKTILRDDADLLTGMATVRFSNPLLQSTVAGNPLMWIDEWSEHDVAPTVVPRART